MPISTHEPAKIFSVQLDWHFTVISGKNRHEDNMVRFTLQTTPIQKDQSSYFISFLALILSFSGLIFDL